MDIAGSMDPKVITAGVTDFAVGYRETFSNCIQCRAFNLFFEK